LDLRYLKNYSCWGAVDPNFRFLMELLLNLAWLLLALPAYWLWRGSRTAHASRKFTSLQCLLALGCMLVVLFPVVSATDDLRAMRAWKLQTPPALASTTNGLLIVNDEDWHQLPSSNWSVPATPAVARAGRAPPACFPG
jgi:hypothetical protein